MSSGATMGPHQLQDERSFAIHQLVAQRLREDPTLLERPRARLIEWRRARDMNEVYLNAWDKLLSGPLDALLELLAERSEWATAMRHTSPFAGIIDFRTRERVWREVKERLEAADQAAAAAP
jgi:hypothetical protein